MNEKDTIYKFPAAYAREHGELEAYRASKKENIACARAIRDAIRDNYENNCLDPQGVKDVISKFGAERTMYVLANTVQQQDWDGRYSPDNKRWAKSVAIPEDKNSWGDDRNREFVVHGAHPGLVNLFISQARRELVVVRAAEAEGKVTLYTDDLEVRSRSGTWHVIDKCEIEGQSFFLMEHNYLGNDTGCIIVDEHGGLVVEHIFDGLDDYAKYLLKQEVAAVGKLPDDSISVRDMKDYGYPWGGMLPLHEEKAQELMQSMAVYLLFSDGSESMAENEQDIHAHASKGGIFAVEKEYWLREFPAKAMGISDREDDCEKSEKSADKKENPSILGRLKGDKVNGSQHEQRQTKNSKNERDM